MPSRLARRHIEAQEALRNAVVRVVELEWRNLPGYDEEHVSPWLLAVVPTIIAAQRYSSTLTDAYVAQLLKRRPLGIGASVGAMVRNGADPGTVYRRPFVTVWMGLQAGNGWEASVSAGLSRATSTAATDVQLASRSTFAEIQRADPSIRGYERVPDGGACEFCLTVAGAFVKSADAMPLHNNCGCSLEPVLEDRDEGGVPDGVAVHEHGELGPVLADPSHSFTSASDI